MSFFHAVNPIQQGTPIPGSSPKIAQMERKKQYWGDLGMPMNQFLKVLVSGGLVQPLVNYSPPHHNIKLDPSKYCYYHRYPVHTTHECRQMRVIIQELIDEGKIEKGSYEESGARNRGRFPPGKQREFDDLGITTEEAFNGLMRRGMIKPLDNYHPIKPNPDLDRSKYCYNHQYPDHVTNDCTPLKVLIQKLVDEGR